jgi:hypothetical protein
VERVDIEMEPDDEQHPAREGRTSMLDLGGNTVQIDMEMDEDMDDEGCSDRRRSAADPDDIAVDKTQSVVVDGMRADHVEEGNLHTDMNLDGDGVEEDRNGNLLDNNRFGVGTGNRHEDIEAGKDLAFHSFGKVLSLW